jgi:cytochrome c oxidase subunit 2
MQRLTRASGVRAAVAAGLVVLLAPANAQAAQLNTASPQAGLIRDLFWITMGVALLVFFAVEALLIYTSLRFRRRGPVDQPEPQQIHGNTRLEIMWTILPAVILISLFAVSVRSMAELGSAAPNAKRIQVTGFQFGWEFTYPDDNVKATNELRVPVGQPVVLEITSRDVIHSFWVPDLAGKIDANPGLLNRLSLTAERAGLYRGVCAELCGVGHANMLFDVRAMEAGEFEAWLREGGQAAAAPGGPASGGDTARGQQLMVEKGCGACHTIAGVSGLAGTVGPPLTNIGTVAAGRKTGMSAEAYIVESISQPTAFAAPGTLAGAMPPQSLSQDELSAIVAYLLTLK